MNLGISRTQTGICLLFGPHWTPTPMLTPTPALYHINRCVDKVTTHKVIKMYPNRKPWTNKEAFKSGDREAYSLSRSNLKRGIQTAKYNYKLRIEDRFKNNDRRRIWTGIYALTDYKPANSNPPTSIATLPVAKGATHSMLIGVFL